MNERHVDALKRRVNHAAGSRRLLLKSGAALLGGLVVLQHRTGRLRAQEATPCPAPTAEEMRAIATAYFDAFNNGNADALGALLSPDYTQSGALVAQQDREIHLDRLRQNHTAFPDGRYELQDVIVDGDLVAIRHVFTGALQAKYAGVEPAGQAVAVRGVHIHRVVCGQIVETWNNGDALGLYRQIGALPPAGPAARTAEETAGTPAATPESCPATAAANNAAIARRWTEDALDPHDLDVLDEIVSPDLVHHAGLFVDEYGLDALKADFQAIFDGMPDIRFSADVVVAEGDRVAVRWTGSGTQTGEFLGIAPTGKQITFTGTNVYRIACGLIVEGWSEPDSLGLLRQLGVIPAPATPIASN